MRVSPALLACFSLVAISGLPSKAAEPVDSAVTLDAMTPAVDDTATAVLPEAAISESAQSPAAVPMAAVPTVGAGAIAPTFDQLLAGVTNKSVPPMLAQSETDEVPPETVIDT
ncbi:MAG: hypothetical protein AAF635_01090, partial [Cyanobacteria bacterium P01_C01_bin.69]